MWLISSHFPLFLAQTRHCKHLHSRLLADHYIFFTLQTAIKQTFSITSNHISCQYFPHRSINPDCIYPHRSSISPSRQPSGCQHTNLLQLRLCEGQWHWLEPTSTPDRRAKSSLAPLAHLLMPHSSARDLMGTVTEDRSTKREAKVTAAPSSGLCY